MYEYYVYMLASRRNGTLYIDVTNNLLERVRQHKEGLVPGFTKKHGVHRLVYFKASDCIGEAIATEKRLKKWNHSWKIRLIESINPGWRDLYYDEASW